MTQQDNSPVGRLYAALDPSSNMAKIPKHFYVERQNKLAALYAGLLDLAHREGIKRIETTLVQPPADANGHTAICAATVELADGRIFSGIGDANAANVGKMIAMHIIRMAETRSKARALRDALNIGGTAAEEFGGEEDEGRPARPRAQPDQPSNVRTLPPTQHPDQTTQADQGAYDSLVNIAAELCNLTGEIESIPDELTVAGARRLFVSIREKVKAAHRQQAQEAAEMAELTGEPLAVAGAVRLEL